MKGKAKSVWMDLDDYACDDGPGNADDEVNHPRHYAQVPGMECIDVAMHFDFLTGNAIKYLWRHNNKGEPVKDLKKALWYIQKRIEVLEG